MTGIGPIFGGGAGTSIGIGGLLSSANWDITTRDGKNMFEVTWEATLTVAQKFIEGEVLDYVHLETVWDGPVTVGL